MLKKVIEFGRLSKEAVTAESEIPTQTCTERLRETTEDFCQNSLFRGWYLHPGPLEFKGGVKKMSSWLLRREVWYEYSNNPEEFTA